jgi:hypothetical protein
VTLVMRGDSNDKSMSHYLVDQVRSKPNIAIALGSEIAAAYGETQLEAVDVVRRATGTRERRASGAVSRRAFRGSSPAATCARAW